ncbi:hypothetical protein KP509_13G036500 [Ceratopteris richardii]|uniref:Uncharacterized protein n=2 Tax=Ceratopteris richardii TaxID=49495 RepID=A0A8T2TEZ6_CERRI|nr:hypothetical protein KP509_13G036500 [Ceratopteris richardii]
MGWFFGCFGCRSKKNLKHQPPISPVPRQQQRSQCKASLPQTSGIPNKAFSARKGSNNQDLSVAPQVSSSAAVRYVSETYLHGEPCTQVPEKEQKARPWHQLDDLEKELNDLCKKIQVESEDVDKIKGQVGFVKSHGSLSKSLAELTSAERQEGHQSGKAQQGNQLSRFAPAASPIDRISPQKEIKDGSSKAVSFDCAHASESAVFNGIQIHNIISKPTESSENRLQRKQDSPDFGYQLGAASTKALSRCQALPPQNYANTGSFHLNKSQGVLTPELEKGPNSSHHTQKMECSTECKDGSFADAYQEENSLIKKRRFAVNSSTTPSPSVVTQPTARNSVGHNLLCQKRLKFSSSGEQEKGSFFSQSNSVPLHFFHCDSLSPIKESSALSVDTDSESNGHSDYDSTSRRKSRSPSLVSQGKSVTFASTNEEYTTEFSYSHEGEVSEESYINSTSIDDINEGLEVASTDSEETLSDLSPDHCVSPPLMPIKETQSTRLMNCGKMGGFSASQTTQKHNDFVSDKRFPTNRGVNQRHVLRYDIEEELDDDDDDATELFADALSNVSTECSEREYRTWEHRHTDSMDSVSAVIGHSTDDIDTPPKLPHHISTPNMNILGKGMGRVRSKPVSSVLTPVENVSQWKQLKARDQNQNIGTYTATKTGNTYDSRSEILGAINLKKSDNHVAGFTPAANASLSHWISASPGKIRDENTISSRIPSRRGDTINAESVPLVNAPSPGKIRDENTISSRIPSRRDDTINAESVPLVNASFSHWALGASGHQAHTGLNPSFSHYQSTSNTEVIAMGASISHVDAYANEHENSIRVDMSLSHWLKSSSKYNETQRSADSRNQSKGLPNSTMKDNENQQVKQHSTSFEQKLDKALETQGILLQKKIFADSLTAH